MEVVLAEIYDLRRYRDNLVKKLLTLTSKNFSTHKPSFHSLSSMELKYLKNLDSMRNAAKKYVTGKLKTEDPKHIAAIKQYIKMEMLDLSIRNERVALIDEITRAHSLLNEVTPESYPDARFMYPQTHNAYTPYINLLKKESV